MFVGRYNGFHGMARGKIGRLSAVALSKLKPGRHCDGGGLYLQVTRSGARSWIFRFMRQRRAHEMGLGALHTISLAEARQKARECRQQMLDGVLIHWRRAMPSAWSQ